MPGPTHGTPAGGRSAVRSHIPDTRGDVPHPPSREPSEHGGLPQRVARPADTPPPGGHGARRVGVSSHVRSRARRGRASVSGALLSARRAGKRHAGYRRVQETRGTSRSSHHLPFRALHPGGAGSRIPRARVKGEKRISRTCKQHLLYNVDSVLRPTREPQFSRRRR